MFLGNSLEVQWLGLHASTEGDTDSIPGWGINILHAACRAAKKKFFFFFFTSSNGFMIAKSTSTWVSKLFL